MLFGNFINSLWTAGEGIDITASRVLCFQYHLKSQKYFLVHQGSYSSQPRGKECINENSPQGGKVQPKPSWVPSDGDLGNSVGFILYSTVYHSSCPHTDKIHFYNWLRFFVLQCFLLKFLCFCFVFPVFIYIARVSGEMLQMRQCRKTCF